MTIWLYFIIICYRTVINPRTNMQIDTPPCYKGGLLPHPPPLEFLICCSISILRDPRAVSRQDKMFVVKIYCKIETSPGHLLLPNQFYKCLNFLLLIGQKKCFWPISEEKEPGDSRVSLHEVVFIIDRHSCVARSTRKVSLGKFQNRMLATRKNYKL